MSQRLLARVTIDTIYSIMEKIFQTVFLQYLRENIFQKTIFTISIEVSLDYGYSSSDTVDIEHFISIDTSQPWQQNTISTQCVLLFIVGTEAPYVQMHEVGRFLS